MREYPDIEEIVDLHDINYSIERWSSRQAFIKGMEMMQEMASHEPIKCTECKGDGGCQWETPTGIDAEICHHCDGTGTEPLKPRNHE